MVLNWMKDKVQDLIFGALWAFWWAWAWFFIGLREGSGWSLGILQLVLAGLKWCIPGGNGWRTQARRASEEGLDVLEHLKTHSLGLEQMEKCDECGLRRACPARPRTTQGKPDPPAS